MSLLFCTTNYHKFELAKRSFKKHGLDIEQLKIEVDEIQSEEPMRILEHKVREIYDKVKKPLVVTDDSWSIPALNGFPGPYMKSINQWLSPEDWLNLMSDHQDRRVFLESRLAHIDESGITYFEDKQERYFLDTVSEKDGVSILRVVGLKGNNKHLNEIWLEDPEIILKTRTLWEDFIKWYKPKSTSS